MNKHLMCPSCGEEINHNNKIVRTVKIDYFQSMTVNYDIAKCDVCGFSGSIDGSEEKSFEIEKKKSDDITLKKLIEEVSVNESSSYIERAFNLPPRTLNRWKSQGGSAAALALIKLIRTYGWLIKVAEHGYDPTFAKMENYSQTAIQISKDRRGAVGAPSYLSMHTFIDGETNQCFVTLNAQEVPSIAKKDENRNQVFSQFDIVAGAITA